MLGLAAAEVAGQPDPARLGVQVAQQAAQLAGAQPALSEVDLPPEGAVRQQAVQPPARPDDTRTHGIRL